MDTVVTNLYTNGNELKTGSGYAYKGWYHVLVDGTIKSGPTPQQENSIILYPLHYMPTSINGDLLSKYEDDTETTFEGYYSTIPVKNYKNDIDIEQEQVLIEKNPPQIALQPDLFFRKSNAIDYDPGAELFVDDSRNIQLVKGKKITLEFTYVSEDLPENVSFLWSDSFDRLAGTGSRLEIDTSLVNWTEESFTCTVTDTYGSDITNDVTITIVDPYDNPIIFKNILKNGSANQGLAEWDTVGNSPESTGKFLKNHEISKHPYGLGKLGIADPSLVSMLGTVFYHKFGYEGPELTGTGFPMVGYNQWYPKPSYVDFINKFSGSLVDEIQDNYFRAGEFSPITSAELDHGGLNKSSYQIIDLTDYADLLNGKVYGLKGFKAILFGWLGTRADQGDSITVKLEFLDENDNVVRADENFKVQIESLPTANRIVNEYRQINVTPLISYDEGWFDTREVSGTLSANIVTLMSYHSGILQDANDSCELARYKLVRTVTNSTTGLTETDTINALAKTIIVGKTTDMVMIPKEAKKIKVTKRYNHEPGVYDLINDGDEFDKLGINYISDAMVVGLNVRLYPTLIDENGNEVDTAIDVHGDPVISGIDMINYDRNPGNPWMTAQLFDDPDPFLVNIELVREFNNQDSEGVYQIYDARSAELVNPANPQDAIRSDISIVDINGGPREISLPALGSNYRVRPNPIYFDVYKTIITPDADKLAIFVGKSKWIYGSNNPYNLSKTTGLNYPDTSGSFEAYLVQAYPPLPPAEYTGSRNILNPQFLQYLNQLLNYSQSFNTYLSQSQVPKLTINI